MTQLPQEMLSITHVVWLLPAAMRHGNCQSPAIGYQEVTLCSYKVYDIITDYHSH